MIESVTGRFQDEGWNAHEFVSPYDARQKGEAWRIDGHEHSR